MSIKADVQELESLQMEIKSLQSRIKILKQKEKEVDKRIQDYIESKQVPGIRTKNGAVLVEEKEVRPPKKAMEREKDATSILQKYGISNPDKVLQELMEARKGSPVIKRKLKIKKYKEDAHI